MDRIHDKANKLINEVRKKKIKMSNIGTRKDHKDRGNNDIRSVSDLTDNACLFCEKVFVSSHYLMKHVYRRHAENLMKLHRKCLLLDSNSSRDFKSLFTFLEDEFLVLKNELCIVKQAIGHKIPRNEVNEKSEESKESVEYVRHKNENHVCSDIAVTNTDCREIQLLKEKVYNIECNIQCLYHKIEELNSDLKTEILFKQDDLKHKVLKEENLIREQELRLVELRNILLKELKCTLSKELSENNLEWNSKFSELKHDILKLDHVISSLKKQIDSPDYLTQVEKRLEHHIVNFLGTPGHNEVRKNLRVRDKSSKVHRASQNNKTFETNVNDKQFISPRPELSCKPNLESNKLHISPEELSFLIAERLSHFNISHTASKLSSSEYEKKLKLINHVKEDLNKKYHNFSEIYKNINLCADQRVFSKLKNKKSRKLRFSEPLILNEDRTFNLKPKETDFLNKSYPILENKNKQLECESLKMSSCGTESSTVFEKQRPIIPTSERFSFLDIGGGGECSGNFPELYHNSVKDTFIHKPTKEYETSSPTADIHNSEKTDCSTEKNSFINFPLSSDCYKNTGSETVEIENTTYHMLDDFGKQDMPFLKPFKMNCNTELKDINAKLDDFDKNSLKSLSSWEDEEDSS